jgi:hypothetical protein
MEKDDEWLKSHLEEIVNQYARKLIAILDRRVVSVGKSIEEAQSVVAEKYLVRVPLVFEVPSPEEFECLLSSMRRKVGHDPPYHLQVFLC